MRLRVRKPTICICEKKDANQLISHTDSTTLFYLIQNFKLLCCFRDYTGRFVSDLVGNPTCWFSHEQYHICFNLIGMDKYAKILLHSIICKTEEYPWVEMNADSWLFSAAVIISRINCWSFAGSCWKAGSRSRAFSIVTRSLFPTAG